MCVETIEGLIKEQYIAAEEEKKIKLNKNLTFVDKFDAVKSVRSLSKTIEGLIGREKEKISEICRESQTTRNAANAMGFNSMKMSDVHTFDRVFRNGSPTAALEARSTL